MTHSERISVKNLLYRHVNDENVIKELSFTEEVIKKRLIETTGERFGYIKAYFSVPT